MVRDQENLWDIYHSYTARYIVLYTLCVILRYKQKYFLPLQSHAEGDDCEGVYCCI